MAASEVSLDSTKPLAGFKIQCCELSDEEISYEARIRGMVCEGDDWKTDEFMQELQTLCDEIAPESIPFTHGNHQADLKRIQTHVSQLLNRIVTNKNQLEAHRIPRQTTSTMNVAAHYFFRMERLHFGNDVEFLERRAKLRAMVGDIQSTTYFWKKLSIPHPIPTQAQPASVVSTFPSQLAVQSSLGTPGVDKRNRTLGEHILPRHLIGVDSNTDDENDRFSREIARNPPMDELMVTLRDLQQEIRAQSDKIRLQADEMRSQRDEIRIMRGMVQNRCNAVHSPSMVRSPTSAILQSTRIYNQPRPLNPYANFEESSVREQSFSQSRQDMYVGYIQ